MSTFEDAAQRVADAVGVPVERVLKAHEERGQRSPEEEERLDAKVMERMRAICIENGVEPPEGDFNEMVWDMAEGLGLVSEEARAFHARISADPELRKKAQALKDAYREARRRRG